MPVEVIGIDHIYISVRSLSRSEKFYDAVLGEILGFRKNTFVLKDNPHIQYYNRHFGFVIRQAQKSGNYDAESPGSLHHFCFRVNAGADVDGAAAAIKAAGIAVSQPKYYTDYAPDYYAAFFEDPDGVKLEITNFRKERRERMESTAF